MVGQEIGLDFLIPLAIEKLQNDILAEGDFYPGDLLVSVLNVDRSFWLEHHDLYDQVKKLVKINKQSFLKEGISLELFNHRVNN